MLRHSMGFIMGDPGWLLWLLYDRMGIRLLGGSSGRVLMALKARIPAAVGLLERRVPFVAVVAEPG